MEQDPAPQPRVVGSRIGLAITPGWVLRDSLQVFSPDRRIHLLVSGEPLRAGTTLSAYSAGYRTTASERLPGFELIAEESSTLFSGRESSVHIFSWAAPDRPPVTQVQVLCVVAERGYVATATVPAAFFPTAREFIMQLLGAVTISEPLAPPTGAVPIGDAHLESASLGDLPETTPDWTDARRTWVAVEFAS